MIRFAAERDCNNLAVLSIQVWLETYAQNGLTEEHSKYVLTNFTPEKFKAILESEKYKVVVAANKSNLIGLAVINLESHFHSIDNGFEIERLYIHQSFRKSGYGRAMFEFISAEIGISFWLYTWVENASNSFYEHLGFQKIGEHLFNFGQQEIKNNVYALVGT